LGVKEQTSLKANKHTNPTPYNNQISDRPEICPISNISHKTYALHLQNRQNDSETASQSLFSILLASSTNIGQ